MGRRKPHIEDSDSEEGDGPPRVRRVHFNLKDSVCMASTNPEHVVEVCNWTPSGEMNFEAQFLDQNFLLAEHFRCTQSKLYEFELWMQVRRVLFMCFRHHVLNKCNVLVSCIRIVG